MALLTEPYLLDPRPGGVHVVWHTAAPGGAHAVLAGPAVTAMDAGRAAAVAAGPDDAGPGWRRWAATTAELSRLADDTPAGPVRRPVHRHLALVTGLAPGRTPYRVVSADGAGPAAVSATYTLAPAAAPGAPVRLLLTSDHQLKPMVPANLAAVGRTVGVELDGILFAGDFVNVPDRAGDWFDADAGPGFFPAMTGRGGLGAPLLQHAPLFPAIGNHEVTGPASAPGALVDRFHAARPGGWDVTSYAELFPVPASAAGGPRWWARTVGDVRVISLFVTRMWQDDRATYGGSAGQFLLEPVGPGSAQHAWLVDELASPACRDARYRVVLFHHPAHGLGAHSVPAYTDPVPDGDRLTYPRAADVLLGRVEPLLAAGGVQLVLTGHNHLWNRFRSPAGVHWLETSNVGNSYGAYHRSSGRVRPAPDGPDHVAQGDPGGLDPVVPTLAPLTGPDGTPLPYLASNHVTAFSVLDSGAGTVRSYRHDTRDPAGDVVLFDEFPLV